MGIFHIFMPKLSEYIYSRGGARMCLFPLAVWRWQAIPDASPIGPPIIKKKCSFPLGQRERWMCLVQYFSHQYQDYHNWKRPDDINVPSVMADDHGIHSARHLSIIQAQRKTTPKRQSKTN